MKRSLENSICKGRTMTTLDDAVESSTKRIRKSTSGTLNSADYEKPSEYAVAIFESNGSSKDDAIELARSKQVAPTPQMIEAYTMEISAAVREGDLETLKRLHSSGANLDCCSRFGQHVLHIACLRGHLEVVKFLIEEAEVSVSVVDDMGRSPFHDACWSSSLNFEILKLMMTIAPEVVLCPDRRGHTPLDYTRQRDWKEWMKFLTNHQNLMTLENSK
eukprot:scaffold874_cov126-Cylindrotheca_fusiformis.AAC.17